MAKVDIPEEHLFISLSEQREAILTVPWFVGCGRYPPRSHTAIEPLVNGACTFGAVHEAISGAAKSIDIVSWGFDPSMRLLRPSGERIGNILRKKADEGKQVRILIWKNALANFGENNIIGDGLLGSGGASAGIGSGVGSTAAGGAPGKDGTDTTYGVLSPSGSAGVSSHDDEARKFNREWFKTLPPNIAFRTRDYSFLERAEIFVEQFGRNPTQQLALTVAPSHHQKMILVDYEVPEKAIGFVMGHNLLNDYWDDDDHVYHSDNRLGFKPWQDLSSKVRGPVLFDLNDNFSMAWDDAAPWLNNKLPLPESRRTVVPDDFVKAACATGKVEMAQITRTQIQGKDDKSILASYQSALVNARNYVYFENQYFRYKEFAMDLRAMRRKLKSAGWKRDLYVFVVTNIPENSGRLATYEMLAALGKADAMPKIEKTQAMRSNTPATGEESIIDEQFHRVQEEKRRAEDELRKADLEGLNIHICTLAAYTDSPPKDQSPYKPIYVHSKLLLVDDTFFSLGSANVNVRSMEVDSELCIACPSERLTRQWREHLWRIHTKRAPGDDIAQEFDIWGKIMQANKERKKENQPLREPLLEFYDESSTGFKGD